MVPETARRRLARQLLREASLELARLRRIRGAYRKTWRRIARAQARLAFAAALLAAAPIAEPAAAAPHFRHGFILDPTGAGSYLDAPAFADIDGDGDVDLFIGTAYGSVLFFEDTGTATQPAFAAPVTNPFGLGNVGSPNFADLDGDGDLDAWIGTRFFQNTGTATAPSFAAPLTNPFGLAADFFEFADLDADGDLDALAADPAGPLLQENTGTASGPAFAAAVPNPFGLTGWGDVDFADVDGDGDLDAFVDPFEGYTISFFENTGSASAAAFAAPVSDPFGLIAWRLGSADFADVDGDGDLDALVTGRYVESPRVTAFENTGTASAPAFTPLGNPFGFGEVVSYSAWNALALADLDGDGDLDAFISESYHRTISFSQNTGTASAPAFAAPGTNPLGLSGLEPDFADIDDDGDLDAFTAAGVSTRFFRNTGTATSPAFAGPTTNPFGLTNVALTQYSAPAFVDIDGDGDLDAFIGDTVGDLAFFRNSGSASAPAFAAPTTNPFGLVDVGYHASPAFADLDGDGDLDAWIGNSAGNTLWQQNTGSANAPAFAAPVTNPFGLVDVGYRASPALADVDADGDLDAFVGAGDTRAFFFENVSIDPEACTDGLDNDGDGRIDYGNDPGCANAADTSELSNLQCDNGLDDDRDGEIDWRADGSGDPDCMAPRDDLEAPTPPGSSCGLGPELLPLTSLFAAARRRFSSREGRRLRAARSSLPTR